MAKRTEKLEGMLEQVSLNGNVVSCDDGQLIELRPTVGESIGRKFDPETGTGFWNFNTVICN